MNIRKLFTGGEPDVRLDQILFGSNDDLRLALFASLASYAVGTNPNYIIDGCDVTVGGVAPNNTWTMTAGYIWLNDEILQVEAQSGVFNSGTQFLAFSKQTTYRADGDKTFIDATPRQTLEQNRGIITVQGSVSVTELDVINGDRIDDKLKLYIGDASTTNKGVVEKATPTERNAGATDKFIDSELLIGVSGGLSRKVIPIGDWNMDTTDSVAIAHGLTLSNIRRINGIIRRDDDSTYYDGTYRGSSDEPGCRFFADATNINIGRYQTGFFDNSNFDSTSFNRGWIVIDYIP